MTEQDIQELQADKRRMDWLEVRWAESYMRDFKMTLRECIDFGFQFPTSPLQSNPHEQ